jgi:hypothetical protein
MISIADNNTLLKSALYQYIAYQNYQLVYEPFVSLSKITFNDRGIPAFNYRNVQAINQSTSPIIIIDMLGEGVQAALDEFPAYNKNKKYIIFSNGWWDTEYYQFGFEYRLCYTNFLFNDAFIKSISLRDINYFIDKKYSYEAKSKLFSCLIGAKRVTRDYFVSQLKTISIDNYTLQYHGKMYSSGIPKHDIKIDPVDDLDFFGSLPVLANYNVADTMPMDMFNDSYFNLVVESSYNLNEFHLTEKTVKPMIMGMPFVMLGSYKFLHHLRSLGFKTYNELWSEDYDLIEDFEKRADEVVNVVRSLINFDWYGNAGKLQQIAADNLQNFVYNNKNVKNQFRQWSTVFDEISQ